MTAADEEAKGGPGAARRYVDVVYASALRQMGGDADGAGDVTQAVFLVALRKARCGRLPDEGRMVGWLLKVTGYAVKETRRAARRRRVHEERAAAARSEAVVGAELSEMRAVLDAALLKLGALDREVVVRRYLCGEAVAEVAAGVGVTENTASQRIGRALEKLRKHMRRQGVTMSVGSLAVVLAAEAAMKAPAGVAATSGAGAAAVGIAQGAAAMMKMAMVKVVAVTCLAAVVLAGTGVVVGEQVIGHGEQHTATGPAGAGEKAGVAMGANERAMMARWDLVMNQPGVERLKKVLTGLKTESKGYEGFEGDAEQVRLAVRDALQAKEVLMLPQRMGWSDINRGGAGPGQAPTADFGLWTHHLMGGLVMDGRNIAGTVNSGMMDGAAFAEGRKGAVRLRIDPVDFQLTVLMADGKDLGGGKMHMQFQGDVGVGKVVVFAGNWGVTTGVELWHVLVWEAFGCGDDEWKYVQKMGPTEWVESGLAAARKMAERAIAWKSHAAHGVADVGAKWERKLANGGVLRLVGVSRPAQWADCWWDAEGRPVAIDGPWGWTGGVGGVMVAVQAEDPRVAVKEYPGNVMNVNGSMGDERRSIAASGLGGDEAVEVGVGAGPWKDGGAVKVGETLEVAGVKVKLVAVNGANPKTGTYGGSSWIQSEATGRATMDTMEIRIAAFDRGGREVSARNVPDIRFGRTGGTKERIYPATAYAEAAPEDIVTFAVQWRRREWTTFERFAMEPAVSPDGVTTVAATKPAALPGVPGTPDGFFDVMKAAVESGDVKKVRALVVAEGAVEKRMADGMAETLVSGNLLRVAAEAKFGATETDAALVKAGLAVRLDRPPVGLEWKVEGDHARLVSTNPSVRLTGVAGGEGLVRIGGEWRMEMALPKELPAEKLGELEQYLVREAALSKARREVAKEIGEGQYKDAYAARDALQARIK